MSEETAAEKDARQRKQQPRPARGVCVPGQDMKKGDVRKLLGRVLKYVFKNYKFAFAVVMVCIIVSAVATLVGTLFARTLIDDFIIPLTQQANPDFGPLAAALRQLSVVLALGIICTYGSNRIMVNVSQGTLRNIRIELFEKMERLSIGYFDTHSHGDIMSVYTNDVDTLRQVISQTIPQIVNATFSLVITLVSMIVLSVPLTLLSIVMVLVMLLVTTKIAKKAGVHFMKQQANLGAVNGYIEEMVEGQRIVKVFCHEEKSIEGFRAVNDELRESAYKANLYANIIMPVNANIGNISYVFCAILGAFIALAGGWGLTLGTLVAFLSLNRGFTQPVTQISQQVNSIVMAMAGAGRVFALMDEIPEVDEGTVELVNVRRGEDGALEETDERTRTWAWKNAAGELTEMKGHVVFEDVEFGYTPEKTVLHDIDLYAKPGQKIAFVGETGAGKTTITNLINRFYDIQQGHILYDGIDVKDIRKDDLRHSLGIVLQDVNLFTGTVMENIRFGRLEATDEECIEAAKLANADGFIRRLPDGYQTQLAGNGSNLSQGQRQLISIARAAVADPPVLILDEATSSIDTRTETLVQRGMDALMADRTSFVIAHRLSTVRDSDCIMVLENGRIIERGNHDDLLEQQGKYYQLYTGKAIS
ncbi:MAG: ABC transporter ATP-binding protein [Coriobacteriales bacterium]